MGARFSWDFSSASSFRGPAFFSTFAAGEEGGRARPAARPRLGILPITTLAVGEEGGGGRSGARPRGAIPLTTLAIGEEGGPRPTAILPLNAMRIGRW